MSKEVLFDKIALIELSSHNEVLHSYIIQLTNIFKEIYVFTTERNYCYLYEFHAFHNIKWQIKSNIVSVEEFIAENNQFIESCNIAIVTSNSLPNGKFLSKNWNTPTGLLVHNFHSCFDSKNNKAKISGFKDFLREVYYTFKRINSKTQKVIRTYEYFIVPDETILEYVHSNFSFEYKFGVIPIVAPNNIPTVHERNTIKIAVPGTLQMMSRNYDLLASVLKLLNHNLNNKVELTLLGKPSKQNGNNIIQKFPNHKNLIVRSFNEEVPQKLFDEILNDVDFCVLPINEYIRYGNVYEKSGFSWMSGNINDIISRGIPSIIPNYIPINRQWEKVVVNYKNENDLEQIIHDWIQNRTFNTIKNSLNQDWINDYKLYNKILTIRTLREIINS